VSKTLVFLCVSIDFHFCEHSHTNLLHKLRQLAPTVGIMRFIYVRSMVFESATKFLSGSRLVFECLLFIADKMRDLSSQEPES
jgi:hypothetical protein